MHRSAVRFCILVVSLAASSPRPAAGQEPSAGAMVDTYRQTGASGGAVFSFELHTEPKKRNAGETLLAWVRAAESHHAGQMDAAAQTIARWSLGGLETVIEALEKPVRANGLSQPLWIVGARSESVAKLIESGIVLHTDIAALAFHSLPDVAANTPGASVHLGAAMELVDFLRLHTRRDQTVQLPVSWYRATLAFLEGEREVTITPAFADRAVSLFPGDPELLLMAGCAREVIASPRVQDAVDVPWVRIKYGSEEKNLPRAAAYYRQALNSAPGSFETHVRLGHVLGLLGQHREALEQLKALPQGQPDAELRYFADLFLGQELAAAGDTAAARDAYQRAHRLFPDVQSIHLALSRLARQDGDVEGAVAAVHELLNLRIGEDPWNRYYQAGLARQAGDVLDRFRAQFGAPLSTEIKQP